MLNEITYTRQEMLNHIIDERFDGENEMYVFDSMHNYLNYCDPRNVAKNGIKCKNNSNDHYTSTLSIKKGDRWTFDKDKDVDTYSKRLADWEPYDDVIKEIEDQKTQFFNDPKVQQAFKRLTYFRRTRKFTIDDGELVIDRVMSGDPEYYQKSIRKQRKRGVRIFLNFSQNCGQNYKTFASNTVEMFKISYIFELMGLPVQILTGFLPYNPTYGNITYSTVAFMLKHENEQINLKKSALIACPGFLRYHGFMSGALMFKNEISGGYGSTRTIPDSFKKFADLDFMIGQENKSAQVLDELLKLL